MGLQNSALFSAFDEESQGHYPNPLDNAPHQAQTVILIGTHMETLRAQLLGAARINASAGSMTFVDDKRHQLLAYLACKADWVGREQLAFLFWPETDTQHARKNLRHLIQRVRGLDWLEGFDAEIEHVRWRVQSDVTEFKHALEQSDWDEALALYGGPLLDGVQADDSPGFAHWLESERALLQDRWRSAALHQARTLEERGEHTEALRVLESLLEHDPLDEDALDRFMYAAAEAGQRGTALRAFEGFARSAAADRLVALGEGGKRAVQPLLDHERLEVRMAAARVLHGQTMF